MKGLPTSFAPPNQQSSTLGIGLRGYGMRNDDLPGDMLAANTGKLMRLACWYNKIS